MRDETIREFTVYVRKNDKWVKWFSGEPMNINMESDSLEDIKILNDCSDISRECTKEECDKFGNNGSYYSAVDVVRKAKSGV